MSDYVSPIVTIGLDEYSRLIECDKTLRRLLSDDKVSFKMICHPYWGYTYMVMDDSDMVEEFFGDLEDLRRHIRTDEELKPRKEFLLSKIEELKKKWFNIWRK